MGYRACRIDFRVLAQVGPSGSSPFGDRSKRVVTAAGAVLARGGAVSEPYGREELEEATREYVDRLKEAYPGINERDLYDLVYEIARKRIEEAEG